MSKNLITNILNSFKKKKNDDSFSFADTVDANEGLLSALTPDYILEDNSYVQLGSNFTRTLILMEYQTILYRNSIQTLQEINKNVSFSFHFERANMSEIRKQMAKAIKQGRNRQFDNNLDEATKAEAELQGEDARRIIRDLATGNEVMYHAYIFIHIVASTLDELERVTQQVKSLTGAIGTAYNPNKKALASYKAFLPILNREEVSALSQRLLNSEAVSYFFPFHENEMFDEDGLHVGINEQTKNVILVDRKKLLNKHKFYIGMSGLGKSTAIFKDIINEWRDGAHIIALDPKGEFGPRFKNMGGEHVRFDMSGAYGVNLFDLPKQALSVEGEDDYVSINPIHDKIPRLLVTFRLMYNDINSIRVNILSSVLEEMYRAKGINENTDFSKLESKDYPIFSDFDYQLNLLKENDAEKYEYVKEFHLAIANYVTGIYSKVFNRYTNVNIDNDLIAYDTVAFNNNEDIQRILYYIVMDNMMNTGINNHELIDYRFIFDEAHVIADPNMPLAMKQLYFMMKVLRSFNVGVSPATQSITDFLSAKDDKRNYGEAVISQSVQKLFLPLDASEIKKLQEELGYVFSKKERSILTVKDGNKSKQAGKGILFVGAKKIQCSVVLNDVEKQIWFEKKQMNDIVL